jgi:hypothetical protein
MIERGDPLNDVYRVFGAIEQERHSMAVTWNDVRFVPATSTAPTDGRVC